MQSTYEAFLIMYMKEYSVNVDDTQQQKQHTIVLYLICEN